MSPIKLLDLVTLPMVPSFNFATSLGLYAAWSVMLYLLARRTRHKEAALLAFVPFVNFGLLFKLAGLSPWLGVLSFVPGVNVVALFIAYRRLMKQAGRPGWWSLLMFINPLNVVFMGVLAATYEEKATASLPEGISYDPTLQQELDPFTQKPLYQREG